MVDLKVLYSENEVIFEPSAVLQLFLPKNFFFPE